MALAAAKTNDFLLGVAEVQMGAMDNLFSLTKTANSLGLVKNFTLQSDPQYTELQQGVRNTIVDSALTSNAIRATMEVYEATASNIKYGLGLDGSASVATNTEYALASTALAAATTLVVATDLTGTFTANSWLVVYEDDDFHFAKVASVAYSDPNTTITITGFATPREFTSAAKVMKVNTISVGESADQPYLSAKVIGALSNNEKVYLLFPKLRVVRGFSLAFTSGQYGNMPFEFTPYELATTDALYGKFPSNSGTCFIAKRK